ncbi:hypothetical protein KAU32_09715 [bacterium]|nr:hypothetical protein [bacterium]
MNKSTRLFFLFIVALAMFSSCHSEYWIEDPSPFDVDHMGKAIDLYRDGMFADSLITLDFIQLGESRYFHKDYYTMLNFLQLRWFESALKIAKEILPYSQDDESTFMIHYVRLTCRKELETISRRELRMLEAMCLHKERILADYGF